MDIFDEIKSEHDEFREIISTIVDTTDRAVKTREENFKKLYVKLLAHHQSEEEVLVPLLKERKETKEFALEIEEEHHVVDTVLEELRELPVSEENWLVKFEVAKMNMDHHMEDEEEDIKEKAREVFDKETLEALVEEFEAEMDRRIEEIEANYKKA